MCSEQYRKQSQIYYKKLMCKSETESEKGIGHGWFLEIIQLEKPRNPNRLMLFQKHLEVSYSFKISKQYKWACNSHWQWSSLHSVQSSGTMWIINMIWKKVPKSSQSSHCLQTQMPSFHCKMALAAGMSVMCKDWNPVRNSPNFQPMQLLSYANYSRDGQRVVGNMAK